MLGWRQSIRQGAAVCVRALRALLVLPWMGTGTGWDGSFPAGLSRGEHVPCANLPGRVLASWSFGREGNEAEEPADVRLLRLWGKEEGCGGLVARGASLRWLR